jgi:hypothetical protein
LTKKATLSLTLSLNSDPADLFQIQQSLTQELQEGKDYAGWFQRLGPKLSENKAKQLFEDMTLRMAWDRDFSPQERRLAELLRSSLAELSPTDRIRLGDLLAQPPDHRADAFAQTILKLQPDLSPKAGAALIQATLRMTAQWDQASSTQRELSDLDYRGFRLPQEQRPEFHKKLLQAVAADSQAQLKKIRQSLR